MIIDIHTHKKKSHSIYSMRLTEPEPSQFYSYGVHPWSIGLIDQFKPNLLSSKKCVALGEIGLDRACEENFEEQIKVFRSQIIWARKYDLPIILHCVRAYYDCLKLLVASEFKKPVVFHDYNGNIEITKRLLQEKNFFFSLGANFYKDSKSISKSALIIPNDRILLETDDSEEIDLEKLLQKISILKDKSLEEIIYHTTLKVFNKLI